MNHEGDFFQQFEAAFVFLPDFYGRNDAVTVEREAGQLPDFVQTVVFLRKTGVDANE